MKMITHGVSSYFGNDEHRYVHFVDGGITDNLGLRAVHDIIEMSGGIQAHAQDGQVSRARRLEHELLGRRARGDAHARGCLERDVEALDDDA